MGDAAFALGQPVKNRCVPSTPPQAVVLAHHGLLDGGVKVRGGEGGEMVSTARLFFTGCPVSANNTVQCTQPRRHHAHWAGTT